MDELYYSLQMYNYKQTVKKEKEKRKRQTDRIITYGANELSYRYPSSGHVHLFPFQDHLLLLPLSSHPKTQ